MIGSTVVLFRLCEAMGRGKMFHLISDRCEYNVRCVMHRLFTHNFMRNKGDSLAAIVGHIEPSISRKLDVVVG